MTNNWYIILDLELDPPVEDEQKIEDKIEECKRYWSRNANDFKRGSEYRALLDQVPKIKKDMTGPENRRKELAKEAREIVGAIDRDLSTAKRKKGRVTTKDGKTIAERHSISVDLVKKRADRLGIKFTELKDYQALYDKYYTVEPLKPPSYDDGGIKPKLSSFNAVNLYDFLYADTKIKTPGQLSCEELRQKAAEKKKTFNKNDGISGNGQKLCTQCEITFKDKDAKDIYDKYLCSIILKRAKEDADLFNNELQADDWNKAVNQLTQIFGDELSEKILEAFCVVEDIPFSNKEASKEPKPEKPKHPEPTSTGSAQPEKPGEQPTNGPIIVQVGPGTDSRSGGGCLSNCLIVFAIVFAAIFAVSFLIISISDRNAAKKERQQKNDAYDQILDTLEAQMNELENEGNAPEIPEEESSDVEPEQETDRHGLTDEEWFFNGQSDDPHSPPHGYNSTEDAGSMDDDQKYYAAGGNASNKLKRRLVHYIGVWADEKEKAEGDEYWADEHIEGVTSSSELEAKLNTKLLFHLNHKAILRYTREIMESSIWEELRAYVGDAEADSIDQEMYELIQNEEEILANMGQN